MARIPILHAPTPLASGVHDEKLCSRRIAVKRDHRQGALGYRHPPALLVLDLDSPHLDAPPPVHRGGGGDKGAVTLFSEVGGVDFQPEGGLAGF